MYTIYFVYGSDTRLPEFFVSHYILTLFNPIIFFLIRLSSCNYMLTNTTVFFFIEVSEDEENENEPTKAIDIINKKISKLDGIFSNLHLVKMRGRPSSYEIQPDIKTREEIAHAEEKEAKIKNLFSGIYSMKTVIYNMKTSIPPPISFVCKTFFLLTLF